jgi:nicotinate (nicotinamide) nucleotide adenylyltransferase
MTRKNIAIFGGSFNPPGVHHRMIAKALAEQFHEVLVVPCGPRPDKPVTNDVPSIYRATMVDMTFQDLERVRVDLFDLESGTFTRTHELEERFRGEGNIWHVIGGDLMTGGADGKSPIHTEWEQGREIWDRLNFVVLKRPGFSFHQRDLPPNHRVVEIQVPGSSSQLRDDLFHRKEVGGRVLPVVHDYIERHGLYRGVPPTLTTLYQWKELRPLVIADPDSADAQHLARTVGPSQPNRPNLIVVIGGDGTMLRAIRREWRRRVPFYGINTGHLGFLLNTTPPRAFAHQGLRLAQLPLLRVDVESSEGKEDTALAFNDAWVERASGQAAWLEVRINGMQRVERLVADGVLVATAAGSTSYARAMGAPPLPLGTQALLLVGSNVFTPSFWKPAVLPLDSTIELSTLDPARRPLRCYVDGVFKGDVHRMQARASRIAAVELAFDPANDLAEKLAKIQFPAA